MNKTSTRGNAWLWMGAAISIAEIMNGAMLASLGAGEGLLASLLGRLVGILFLGLVGYIGAKNGLNSMESVQLSFGKMGRKFFSLINVIQLVGWTAVMVVNGAAALNLLLNTEGDTSTAIGCIGIGVLIAIWLFLDSKHLIKLNSLTVWALMVCCAYLSWCILGVRNDITMLTNVAQTEFEPITFGIGVELSIAMPLSWIPLIADYNKEAENPVKSNWVGSLSYGIGGFWMSTIGLLAAIYTGYNDVSALMGYMGLGAIALFIVALSTVTTTYLDVKSAAISYGSIFSIPKERLTSFAVIILGVLIAINYDSNTYMDFLYYIGSCFAPMVAILITDFFFLHKTNIENSLNLRNGVLWILGFGFYRYLIKLSMDGFDPVVGISIPVLIVVMIVTYLVGKLVK